MAPGGDEVHTVNFAFDSLFTNVVPIVRVGESTRWLARAFIPLATYYMNGKMGGEHYITGWNYPGISYLKRNFKDTESINGDPNIQDFVYALKMCLGISVILSFLIASYFLLLNYGSIASIAYFSIALSANLINEMLAIFYTESTLVIIFNLIVVLGLKSDINNNRRIFWSAFITAFSISTKLTGVVFIAPIIYTLQDKIRDFLTGMKLEVYLALTVGFLLLINVYSTSYIDLLDQTLANVYHLKTGHLSSEPGGIFQIKKIINNLSYFTPLFLFSCICLIFLDAKNKLFLYSIVISVFLILISMVDVSFSITRNLSTPLVMMVFIISIVSSLLVKKICNKYIFLVFLLFPPIFFSYKYFSNFNKITYQSLDIKQAECRKLGYVNVGGLIYENSSEINGMPYAYTLKDQLPTLINQFSGYDCVLVNRINNNKQYTNYILPLYYRLVSRKGDYFLFKIKQ
jgi:hypothetical protein